MRSSFSPLFIPSFHFYNFKLVFHFISSSPPFLVAVAHVGSNILRSISYSSFFCYKPNVISITIYFVKEKDLMLPRFWNIAALCLEDYNCIIFCYFDIECEIWYPNTTDTKSNKSINNIKLFFLRVYVM